MATDGSLSIWGSNGPVVWHSETSGLDLWHVDGIYSDYKVGEDGGGTAKIPWLLFYAIREAI